MLYSQLSELKELLNSNQLSCVEKYLCTNSKNSKITTTRFAIMTDTGPELARKVLKKLVDNGTLEFHFAIRCPECDLLLASVDSPADIEKEVFCYSCEREIAINADDVEVFYTIVTLPFVEGQQKCSNDELVGTAVQHDNSLAQLLAEGYYDLSSEFYSPSEEDYNSIKEQFYKIFSPELKAKAKGDSLEDLVMRLFNICKHFNAKGIRLRPNQIDCYVRNKLFVPGVYCVDRMDSFVIECKNEKSTPKAEYMNKIHSILEIREKKYGIIVSKQRAPQTFKQLSHDIFLSSKIVIVSIDNNDLKNIVIKRDNLLECLARKIDEVKLYATTDLRAAGLYDA